MYSKLVIFKYKSELVLVLKKVYHAFGLCIVIIIVSKRQRKISLTKIVVKI